MKTKTAQLFIFTAFLFSSCNGDPAEAICDCYNDVNEMKPDDQEWDNAARECEDMAREKFENLKNDTSELRKFHENIKDCESMKKVVHEVQIKKR